MGGNGNAMGYDGASLLKSVNIILSCYRDTQTDPRFDSPITDVDELKTGT